MTPTLARTLGVAKPVIAMVHLPALPGAPLHDAQGGMEAVLASAAADLDALLAAGVDAVMFGNENDRPYELQVDPASTAAAAYVIGRLRERLTVPFGVDMLWDPRATLALAAGTGAAFAREIFTGVHASDMGLWAPDAAAAARDRARYGRPDLALLFNIAAEFAGPVDPRPLADIARSVALSSLPDALLVSGPLTGQPAPLSALESVKAAVPDIPVLANTGVRHDTVADTLALADGCIVGSALKIDGDTWNPVDPDRAADFMARARAARGERP
ncbi:MAG: BtpA/SgcQ family protein [Pseudomonadota bacterium]